MNIAFVNATKKWGGVKTWILDFSEELKNRGHHVYIYGRQQEFTDAALRRVGHGRRMAFGFDMNPATIWHFITEFRRHAVDIVFVNVKKDLATAGVAARMLGIPVVQQVGLPQDIPPRVTTELLHKAIAPQFLCSCKFIADGFRVSLPYLEGFKIHTVLTAKRISERSTANNSKRRIIMTQQLNADKEHSTILHALASIDTPYELHIVGTGNNEAQLKKEAAELGLAGKVVWHGFSNDVQSLLRACDIFILASTSEGLPNTLQEAMSEGLLPITRNVGGVLEVIDGPLADWVLPYAADAEAFHDAIRKALSLTEAELTALKDAARDAGARHFSIDTKAEEFENLIRGIISHA